MRLLETNYVDCAQVSSTSRFASEAASFEIRLFFKIRLY
jgi:hypothetical protein